MCVWFEIENTSTLIYTHMIKNRYLPVIVPLADSPLEGRIEMYIYAVSPAAAVQYYTTRLIIHFG